MVQEYTRTAGLPREAEAEYDKRRQLVEKFIDECKQHSHYQHLNARPERFSEWEEDHNIRQQYFHWVMNDSNCPTLKMDIEFPHKEILAEAEEQLHQMVKHRGDIHPGWSSMCIHGQGVEYTDPPKEYPEVEFNGFNWTTLADTCPITKKWLVTEWPFATYDRVRFMLLEPGGYIRPHVDFEERRLAAFNIAVSNPPSVDFAMEEAGLVPWEEGEVRAIDIGRNHSVLNHGTENRIHMIVHGHFDSKFKDLMCRSYDKLIESLSN